MTKTRKNLIIDISILLVSIIFAIWLGDSKVLQGFLWATGGSKFLGSLIGGLLFTSIFTTAPAIVVLGEIAQRSSIWEVALVGAIGSLIGDLIMFKFLRDRLAKDFYALFHVDPHQRYFRLPRFRWLMVLLGGFIIASPFPDELGLAIMGFSQTKAKLVAYVSFLCNFLGILFIGAVSKL